MSVIYLKSSLVIILPKYSGTLCRVFIFLKKYCGKGSLLFVSADGKPAHCRGSYFSQAGNFDYVSRTL
jgi:hypothetical protein